MMKKFLAVLFLPVILALLACPAAMAQSAPPQAAAPGVLGGYAGLAVTAATGRVALPATLVPYGAVTVYNYGTKDAYFKLGSVTVTAATTDTLVASGKHITFWATGTPTYLAAICGGSDTTSLGIYQSTGLLDFGP